jgi:hypothetical protein
MSVDRALGELLAREETAETPLCLLARRCAATLQERRYHSLAFPSPRLASSEVKLPS